MSPGAHGELTHSPALWLATRRCFALKTTSGNIWRHFQCPSWVWPIGIGQGCGSNILQSTEQSPQQRVTWSRISRGPGFRTPGPAGQIRDAHGYGSRRGSLPRTESSALPGGSWRGRGRVPGGLPARVRACAGPPGDSGMSRPEGLNQARKPCLGERRRGKRKRREPTLSALTLL